MAIGDAAAAAGMGKLDGTEDRRDGYVEINRSRDYIAADRAAVRSIAKGGTGQTTAAGIRNAVGLGNTTGALPVANGGTGSTSAAAARTALGITPANIGAPTTTQHNSLATDINNLEGTVGSPTASATASAIVRRDSGGRASFGTPTAGAHAATKDYVDSRPSTGLVAGGAAFGWSGSQWYTSQQVGIDDNLIVSAVISNAFALANPVSTGYASLYVNSDGRYGVTPSAERFKQDITPKAYTLEQLLAIQVATYRLKTAVESNPDAAAEVGVIAEQLIAVGLSEFVIFNEAGETQSVAYERLVLVTIGALQDLATRHAALEARVAKLEGAA